MKSNGEIPCLAKVDVAGHGLQASAHLPGSFGSGTREPKSDQTIFAWQIIYLVKDAN